MDIQSHEVSYRGDALKSLREYTFVVAGCGSLGSNLAQSLLRLGCNRFVFIDFDRVNVHNLETHAFGPQDIGALKASALQSMAFMYCEAFGLDMSYLGSYPVTIEVFFKKKPMYLDFERVIYLDCFDNAEARHHLIHRFFNTLHLGMVGSYGECVWDEHYILPQDAVAEDNCAAPYSLTLIQTLVAQAVEALFTYAYLGVHKSRRFNLDSAGFVQFYP